MTTAPGGGVSICRFGDYELDRSTLELRRAGRKIRLAPLPARALALLVSRPGMLVTREELRHELWGEDTFVDFERNLNYCINCIRDALVDTAASPRYIETLPRRGYRFIADVGRQRAFAEPTLAVMPFSNLNRDPAKEFFADGITDALITELAHLKAVRVISRQSVLHLKGSNSPLGDIARDLGVDGIVEGAVLHEGNRVRVTAQLILMEPERHAWAQSYDCDMSAVLATQRDAAREIASSVASALRPEVPPVPAADPGRAAPEPSAPETIESFLKAVSELHQMSADGLRNALRLFRELTANAPRFAPGWAGYGSCLFSIGWWGHAPAREVYPTAKALLAQAIALDDGYGISHTLFAYMVWLLDWDLAGAEREFRRGAELAPSDPEARILYAVFLCCVGRHADAISEARYGLQLNPAPLLPNQAAAWVYLHSGNDAAAEAQARRTLAAFPSALQPHYVLGWATWRQGRNREAVTILENALGMSREGLSLSFLGHVYARLGRRDEALALLQELDALAAQGKASPVAMAILHAGLGNADAAFEWLKKAAHLRDDLHWLFTRFPGLDPLRPDPRFDALLRGIGPAF